MTRALVIGGGVAGLATAAVLARGGLEVTLLERHDTLGGRVARVDAKGFSLDLGPAWFTSAASFERFFALLGRNLDDYVTLETAEPRFRCFFESATAGFADTWDAPHDVDALVASLDSLSRGDGEATRAYLAGAAADHRVVLDRFTYSTFTGVRGTVTPATLATVPSLVTGLSRRLDKKIAKAVHHPRTRQILGFPAVGLAGSPARLPAGYAFLSHLVLGQETRHPRGGFAAVVDALERLAREYGVEIRTGAEVARILVDPATRVASGVVLHGGAILAADVVVSSTDLHYAETRLLTPEFQSRPESSWRRFRPAPSALVAAFVVKRPLHELALHNLFFPRDWEACLAGLSADNAGQLPMPTFLYAQRPAALDPSVVPKGKDAVVITAPMPADPLLGHTEASRAGLTDLAREHLLQVARWAGIEKLLDHAELLALVTPADIESKYGSWRGSAMGLEHTRTQTAMWRPGNASTRVRNLYYAGSSTLPGVGVASALVSAELVAKRLVGDRGSEPFAIPAEPGFLVRTEPPINPSVDSSPTSGNEPGADEHTP